MAASAGVYWHPDRVQTCFPVEYNPGPSPCDEIRTGWTSWFLYGVAVAAAVVGLAALALLTFRAIRPER